MIVAVPPMSIVSGKDAIVAIGACRSGASAIDKSAVASGPGTALALYTGPVSFVMGRSPAPAAVPLTLSTILQLPGNWNVPAGIVPPMSAADAPPGFAVKVPLQVLLATTGVLVALINPVGYE